MSETEVREHDITPCVHCQFGLIVTGKGEREFLPDLFRALTTHAGCSFKVLRKIDQRPPITERRRLKMVGRGGVIPSKDEVEIGLEARRFLRDQPCHFVILIDDIEHDRRSQLRAIWERYRTAVDTMLRPHERGRASVHFFANMLEAYYFSDPISVNNVLRAEVVSSGHTGDVESIRHPKAELEDLARAVGISFRERRDGKAIVERLDLDLVLSRSDTCGFLRALFSWCVRHLLATCPIWDAGIATAFSLANGVQADLTKDQ